MKNPLQGFSGKQQEAPIPHENFVKAQPSILERLEAEQREESAHVRRLEEEISIHNSHILKLDADIAWLKRTPQAISILTSLITKSENFGHLK